MDPNPLEINVVVRRRPGLRRIEVTGDLDQFGTAEFRRALDAAVAERWARIEVDLSGATLFCCAAVTALMEACEASDGRLVLVGAAPVVRKVLRLVGLTETFALAEASSVDHTD